ncbi:MAG: ECF-type sigma factor [Planctomycetota bacterium]
MTAASHIDEASLSQWMRALQQGSDAATNRLWQTYFGRMVSVARRKLNGARRVDRDEEDIALSAFNSFCLGIRDGRIASQGGPDNLWPLLVTLTINKSIDHLRRSQRLKRGGAEGAQPLSAMEFLDQLSTTQSTPELEAIASDSFQSLLANLDQSGDDTLRQIAVMRLEGEGSAEIAEQLNCTPRTVQRKLKTIAALWEADEG